MGSAKLFSDKCDFAIMQFYVAEVSGLRSKLVLL